MFEKLAKRQALQKCIHQRDIKGTKWLRCGGLFFKHTQPTHVVHLKGNKYNLFIYLGFKIDFNTFYRSYHNR